MQLSLQSFQMIDYFFHAQSFQQRSQMYGFSSTHIRPASVAVSHMKIDFSLKHRGQYEHISNHTQTSCSTCARLQTSPLKEDISSFDGNCHKILLCVVDRQHLHSKVDILTAHTFGQLHVHIHTRMSSGQPSFITPADLALSISVLWIAFVAHVSVNSTAFRRRMFGFCSKRR